MVYIGRENIEEACDNKRPALARTKVGELFLDVSNFGGLQLSRAQEASSSAV